MSFRYLLRFDGLSTATACGRHRAERQPDPQLRQLAAERCGRAGLLPDQGVAEHRGRAYVSSNAENRGSGTGLGIIIIIMGITIKGWGLRLGFGD